MGRGNEMAEWAYTLAPIFAISCSDVLREGTVKDFSKDDILTLGSSTPQQLETCLFILGKDELNVGKAEALWSMLKEVYGSVYDIPEDILKQLGWIISGIPVDDFYNITIPDIDMVSIFGLYRNLTIQQLTALKQTTENQWSRKSPEQLTSYDLIALRQILCAFNDSEIAAIHPVSYRDAASELATLQDCPKSVMKHLADLATSNSAFGKPSKWNSIQVTSIGCVMAGLPSANNIPAESMEGITPHMVKCLPASFLQTMSEQQLQHFTTNAASAISSSQKSPLSSSQKYALDQAITGVKYTKPSRAWRITSNVFLEVLMWRTVFLIMCKEVFQTKLLVQLRWLDPRLEYANKNITSVIVVRGELDVVNHIWMPQIYLAAARVSLIQQTNKDISVHVLQDGTVLFTARLMTDIVCWAKLGRFPFDYQNCSLNIDTWKFTSNDLQLRWEDGSAISWSKEASFLAEYSLVDAAYVTDYGVSDPDSISAHTYNCSSLRVIFSVVRNQGYYFMNYYVPSILIVIVSWVSFWEAPDALPGRCLLGAGTMVTFIALGVDVSRSLPTVPYVRSNDLWFFGCTAFIFCSLAEFAFVNSLWRYGGEVELKKATSKYIIRSSLGVRSSGKPRRRSLSWSSAPSVRWENPMKRVVNNELTVKSLSDLELPVPLSELKKKSIRETFEISDSPSEQSSSSVTTTTTMSYQAIAVWIDKRSRIAFPLCFVLFNIVYWSCLFVP